MMTLKVSFSGIANLSLILGLLTILALNSACSDYELDEEAMEYLWSLPNYWEFEAQLMGELEQNTYKYGKLLEKHNFTERWDSIYFDLIDQNMLWGRHEKAEKIIEKIKYFDSYSDSFFTVPLAYLSSFKFKEFYSRVDFKRIEKLDPDFGVENMRKIMKPPKIDSFSLPDPEYFQNPTKFSYWFYDLLGCRMLLLISAGLYGGYYEELEEENAVKVLDKILISDEYQIAFINRVKYGSLGFLSFLLTSHVFYEKYLRRRGDLEKVNQLENIRFEFAQICNQEPGFGDDVLIHRLLDSRGELPAAKEK